VRLVRSARVDNENNLLAWLDTLFETAPIGLAFVDREFRYIRINSWLAAINGKTVAEHVGRTVMDVQPGLGPQLMETYRRVLETGEVSIEQEFSGADPDRPGQERNFVASHFPVRANGDIIGIGVVVQEITDEKRAQAEAENERRRLRTLFMQAPAAIALLRGPNHVYELSNAANNIGLGRDPTGKAVADAMPEAVEQGYVGLLDRVYQNGECFAYPEALLHVRAADGTMRDAYVTGFYEPMRGPHGEIDGVMVFGFEVTEQVLARRRAEAAEREARAAVRVRDDFMSIAGHELRTPLTALQLYLQQLQSDLEASRAEDRLMQRFKKATAQVGRLHRLVDELLDVSRVSGGRLELHREEFDLKELLSELIERLRQMAVAADCRILLDVPGATRIFADRSRIEQVVTNLLSNALKYGTGRPVEVKVLGAGDVVHLIVTDHGIGIDTASQARVFERFERAAPDREYGGLGMGLWIAREIVHAHGGQIRLHSEPGRGTTVEVELPKR
jgi:PAS domain S-box-containing protein